MAELRAAGVLASTSLMARAAATAEAIEIARASPTLGVGCHVVLVDGEPALPQDQIPSLIDPRTGALHSTLTAFLPRLFTGRIRSAEIEAETRAQIEFLQEKGLRLTHVDTHKHTHMFPAVLRAVLHAARACGIRAVRNPFEPAWALRATKRRSLAASRRGERSAMAGTGLPPHHCRRGILHHRRDYRRGRHGKPRCRYSALFAQTNARRHVGTGYSPRL